MTQRKSERIKIFSKAYWDFFAEGVGKKIGYLGNISNSGCLLKTNQAIENRRWIRLLIKVDERTLYFAVVGRVIRRQNIMEVTQDGNDLTLYHHGIEFTYPKYLNTVQVLEESGNRLLEAEARTLVSPKSVLNPI